jgi:hypothetical protein
VSLQQQVPYLLGVSCSKASVTACVWSVRNFVDDVYACDLGASEVHEGAESHSIHSAALARAFNDAMISLHSCVTE